MRRPRSRRWSIWSPPIFRKRGTDMQQDAARLAYRGRTASIGFARGQFVRVNAGASGKRAAGSPPEEAEAFRNAVHDASRQIAELAAAAGGEAAQILEFQVALLEDEEFLDPVFSLIDDAVAADAAFSRVVDEQIADYNSASDEYLRARSSDLADLRDRVLRILGGGESRVLLVPQGAVV